MLYKSNNVFLFSTKGQKARRRCRSKACVRLKDDDDDDDKSDSRDDNE